MKIDDLDKQILWLLSKDGRISSSEIAGIVNENDRKVVYRVNRLIEKGAISIQGVINYETFGYRIRADVLVQTEMKSVDKAAKKMAEFEEVQYVGKILGGHEISIQVLHKTPADLYKFVSEKIAVIPGVTRTTTHLVPVVIKNIDQWVPPEVAEFSQG